MDSSTVKILWIFVAFLENMNFKQNEKIETIHLKFDEAKDEAKKQRDCLNEKFEKLIASSEVQQNIIKTQNLQFEKCLSALEKKEKNDKD